MWLGSKKYGTDEYYNIKWKLRVKLLGIYFSNCSIMGNFFIVKSLLLPQIIFAMQALVAPADIIKKLNTLLFRFIWKKKYSNTN